MIGEHGGEAGESNDRLAPVIPLFGGVGSRAPVSIPAADAVPADDSTVDEQGAVPPSDDEPVWRSTWDAKAARSDTTDGEPSARHPARGAAARRPAARLRALHPLNGGDDVEQPAPDSAQLREVAEESLVRKLRAKSLSVSEARMVLKGHSLDASQIDDVIDDFSRRGYLDDAVLAEHLVSAGVERKGLGRVALSRALSQRGIPRDVIDEALDEVPDDDAERALEFARTKARSMARLDHETALRRLVGQLARRGYNGSVAMTAARTALGEVTSGGPAGGVRFVDSE
ncbi:regulatory protein RecX [Microbacterium sp.]|uniref:regulatory protein RecX n=1 Tax=Microbacterium sp. TaxID=51671 RepID=UPI002811C9E9|nr:regulatory protein RecX [Microbacterium sp.]